MNCKETGGQLQAKGLRFGLVVSRHNDLFTGQLLKGALDCLARHGANEQDIQIVWVPGAYEQPLAIQKLAKSGSCDALVALGAVIQGATPHAGLINAQVARAWSRSVSTPACRSWTASWPPTTSTRPSNACGSKAGNRGWTAAQTAIEMASLMKVLG